MGQEQASIPGSSVPADSTRAYLRDLETTLQARGLKARAYEGGFLFAANADADADSTVGRSMSPGLSQIVVLNGHKDGSLHWYWQWSGATRDAPPEYEYLCPAPAIETAAESLCRVLALEGVSA